MNMDDVEKEMEDISKKFRLNIEVKVSGIGRLINTEMRVLEKALKEAGYNVTVKNDSTDEKAFAYEFKLKNKREPTQQEINEFIEKVDKNSKPKQIDIELVANHEPWGG